VTTTGNSPYTPSNVHFGLFDPLVTTRKKIGKKEKKELYCTRALQEMDRGITEGNV
jgi:folate-dependent tRNA-U54 methylase TrmFO/GidA